MIVAVIFKKTLVNNIYVLVLWWAGITLSV